VRVTWLADVLRSAGLVVRETDGWKERGAPFKDGVPLDGIVGHHTVSNPPANNPSLYVVTNGRPDLAGPLCQLLLARDGSYDVIASGKANHGGEGYWPGWHSSANSYALAIEAENNGTGEWWSAAIMDAYAEGVAAILEHMGKGSDAFISHFEWCEPPGRKIDPRGPWMQGGGGEDWWSGNYDVSARSADAFRLRVEACMGMTAAQEKKLDQVISMLDSFFGIDGEGKAKDMRLKLDAVYVEVYDENSPTTLGGRLVAIERELKGGGAHFADPD
jgi:N-acetylmuramoyl-L-alanine amidase